jgi:cytochrome c biogenesis protein CcmG/thiol:disulfide interchange protein DsbE
MESTRSRLLRALVVVPAVAFIGLLAIGLRSTAGPPAPGDDAPAWEAARLDGEGRLELSSLKGRPVLLNFWASWCGPCAAEAPMLRRAHDEYGDRIEFVGVDIRDDIDKARAFVVAKGLDYEHVRDERLEIYEDYGLTGQPETFLIDSEGTIVEHVPGPFLSERDLFALLDRLAATGG